MGKGEVLDPITVAIAVFAWLVIYGAQILSQAVGGILNSIPLIGSAISRFTFYLFPEWQNFWSQTPPVSQAVTGVSVNHATEQGLNVEAHKANLGAIQTIYGSAIPQAKSQAVAQAGAIQAPVNAKLQQGLSTLSGVDSWAQQQIHALQQATTVTLPAAIGTVQRNLLGDLQQTAGALQSNIVRTTTALGQQIAVAESTAARNLVTVGGALRGDIGQAATAAEAGAVRAVQPQIGQLQTDLGAIAQQVTTIGSVALPGILTLTQSLVGRITSVEECTGAICESGSGPDLGQLGKGLQQLTQLFELGALFAILELAVKDPKGAATAIRDVAGAPVTVAADGLRALVGV